MTSQLFNEDVTSLLGKKTSYVSQYDKTLLVRENRQRNRDSLGITFETLPFVGYDVWNHYEVSALEDGGLPVAFIGKIVYSCSSKYIVESKSLKLYFGSFNNTRLGKSKLDVQKAIVKLAEQDLSELLEANVVVRLFSVVINSPYNHYLYTTSALCLEDMVQGLEITDYKNTDAPMERLTNSTNPVFDYERFSHLLYSRCKITNQSDSGTIYIKIIGTAVPTNAALLKLIVSMRNENHFHEEVCEKIYVTLWNQLKPDGLVVTCFYNRRGSIDINPTRASSAALFDLLLIDPTRPFKKAARQ